MASQSSQHGTIHCIRVRRGPNRRVVLVPTELSLKNLDIFIYRYIIIIRQSLSLSLMRLRKEKSSLVTLKNRHCGLFKFQSQLCHTYYLILNGNSQELFNTSNTRSLTISVRRNEKTVNKRTSLYCQYISVVHVEILLMGLNLIVKSLNED